MGRSSAKSYSPFCPPQIRSPVDKSSFSPLRDSESHDSFKSSGRTATMQSRTGNGKVERNRGNAGSPNQQAVWSQDSGNVAEAVGTKKTNIKCGIMQMTQRRVGYPKCQGEPTRPSGQVGEPDVRQRKEWPLGQGLPTSDAVGAGSNVSAHLFCKNGRIN